MTTVGLGGGVDENAPPDDRRRRRRALLQGRRPAVAAAHLHARDRDGEPLGGRRGVLPAAASSRPPTSCAASTSARAPFLHGYVATKMKPPPAQEILESELGEPILARWHVGLGWSLAWTSDVKNLWAVEWLRWPRLRAVLGAARARAHAPEEAAAARHARRDRPGDGPRAAPSLDAIGGDDRFENGLDGEAHGSTGPQPGGGDAQACRCAQTAPGRYEADFPLDRYGSFLLHASLEQRRRRRRRASTARPSTVAESFGHVTNPYPREYLALAPDVGDARRGPRRSRAAALDPARGRRLRPRGRVDPLPRGPLAALRRRGDRALPARPPGAPRAPLRPQADGAGDAPPSCVPRRERPRRSAGAWRGPG